MENLFDKINNFKKSIASKLPKNISDKLDLFDNLILKIIDTTNKSNTQAEISSFISISGR